MAESTSFKDVKYGRIFRMAESSGVYFLPTLGSCKDIKCDRIFHIAESSAVYFLPASFKDVKVWQNLLYGRIFCMAE
jgi:hypothetical protein